MLIGAVIAACIGAVLYGLHAMRVARARRNVILITIDNVRADHFSFYGYDTHTAPNLEKLAEESLVFDNAISQSSWTLPAHASIFSGVYPYQHGAQQFQTPMNHNNVLLSEVLHSNGYATAAIVSHLYVRPMYGFGWGFDSFDRSNDKGERHVSSRSVTDLAIQWLKTASTPSFLWLHYFDPHTDFIYHEGTGFPYADNVSSNTILDYACWNVYPCCPTNDDRGLPYLTSEKDRAISLHDGETFYTDYHIGRLIDFLSENGTLDDTILIIVSDHGESFGEHDFFGHDNLLYDDLIHVPLLIRIPGAQPQRFDQVVETRNLMPTLLDLLLIDKPKGLGPNILKPEDNIYACSEVHNENPHRRTAITDGKWKLVYTLTKCEYELYDLEADPGENNDLAQQKPDIVEKYRKELFERMAIVEHTGATFERLRSLGYLR